MEARRLAILHSHFQPVMGLNLRPSLSQISNRSCSSKVNEEQHFDVIEEGKQQKDCIFCKIVRGESPSCKVYEDDVCLCILDRHPLSHGHSLIIPKLHFSSLEATPPSVVAAMCSKVPSISKAIMAITNSDSFNLLVNNGKDAGQVIFHTHIHIIPRKAQDCLWTSQSLPRHSLLLDQDASQLAVRVREQLSQLGNSCDHKCIDFGLCKTQLD